MKNKEIEELLNSIDKIIKEAPDEAIYGIQIKEYKQIKNHIEQLEKENVTLGEIVNIKDEQLKEMQIQKTDYTTVNILEAKLEQLENNRDKAINYTDITIELIEQQPTEDDTWIIDRLKGFKNILRGESNV